MGSALGDGGFEEDDDIAYRLTIEVAWNMVPKIDTGVEWNRLFRY